MIALIALVALAVVVGVLVGVVALLTLVVKAIIHAFHRRQPTVAQNELAPQELQAEEVEFQRIVSAEWPSD